MRADFLTHTICQTGVFLSGIVTALEKTFNRIFKNGIYYKRLRKKCMIINADIMEMKDTKIVSKHGNASLRINWIFINENPLQE